jgi:hypothetical protein
LAEPANVTLQKSRPDEAGSFVIDPAVAAPVLLGVVLRHGLDDAELLQREKTLLASMAAFFDPSLVGRTSGFDGRVDVPRIAARNRVLALAGRRIDGRQRLAPTGLAPFAANE